jgi:ATP-dependent Clp protease ATP-binding subunit ClpA
MNSITLAPDATVALALAATAMPFARDADEEAERWLRILRVHGEAGVALSALGVTESPLEPTHERGADEPAEPAPSGDRDAAQQVTEQAAHYARQRQADVVTTSDVLVAVMQVYGEHFDRVLLAHGTDRDEVLARLEVGRAP